MGQARTDFLPSSRVLLRSRRIFDGTGAPAFSGGVVLESNTGKIECVLRSETAVNAWSVAQKHQKNPYEECDVSRVASGAAWAVAPALIDCHGHSDMALFAEPTAEGKITQGIGWEIAGNCGLSPFPVTEYNREHLQELYHRYGRNLDWQSYEEYRAALAEQASPLQLFSLVGHNTLRAAVAGYEKRTLSPAEIRRMQQLLAQALEAGALGLSSGLLYVPGKFADEAELTALLEVVAHYDKIYTTHLRSEGDRLEEALAETLRVARASGLKRLHLSHLKTAGSRNFCKIVAIERALAATDLTVSGDLYPYDASMTQLSVILPAPYDDMGDVELERLLQSATERARAAELMTRERAGQADYFERITLGGASPGAVAASGMSLGEAARQQHLAPAQLVVQLLAEDASGTTAVFHTLSLENMRRLARSPKLACGTDEIARNRSSRLGISHPRGFGGLIRFLRLLHDEAGETWEQAIFRVTGYPAKCFQLHGCGVLREGASPGVTLLDLEHMRDQATFVAPHLCCVGCGLFASGNAVRRVEMEKKGLFFEKKQF